MATDDKNKVYNYKMLFKVVFNHSYFPDNIFRGYVIYPTAPSAAAMESTGLLCWLPPDRSAFEIWYDTITWPFDGVSSSQGFNKTLHFYFFYQLVDPLFYTYTKLLPPAPSMTPPVPGTKTPVPAGTPPLNLNCYFFANHDESLIIKSSSFLTKNGQVSTADEQMGVNYYIDNNIGSFTNSSYMPFGLISILWDTDAWNKAVTTAPAGGVKVFNPPEYTITFPPTQSEQKKS